MRAKSAAVTLLASLLAASCAEPRPRTEVMIELDGDLLVRRASRQIEIRVWGGPRGVTVPNEAMQMYRFDIAAVGGWPVTHAVLPENHDASRLFRVEGQVFAENDDVNPIGTVRAVSGYVEGRTLLLRLRFHAACLYVDPCERPDESCGEDGNCEPSWQPPGSLVDFNPNTDGGIPSELCASDLDCADTVECTMDQCLPDGRCVNVLDDTACMAMPAGRCDAVNGCQYGTGPCTPTSCVATPCELSAQCMGDVCMRIPRCMLGEPCCAGTCGTCNDGEACTDDSCDETMGGCVGTPNSEVCDDGTYCNGTDTCAGGDCTGHAGDPCMSPLVCDEAADGCSNCTSDAQCTPPPPMNGMCVQSGGVCSTAGTMTVTMYTGRCAMGTCNNDPMVGSGSCVFTPDPGSPCGTTEGPWGPCEHDPPSDICGTNGLEYRNITTLYCGGGSCSVPGSPGREPRPCNAMPDPSCADAGPCGCATSRCEMPEVSCDDGEDNDCDGPRDCADPDCVSATECGTDGGMDGGPLCAINESVCYDGIDDDCDLDTDCADSECSSYPGCSSDGGGCFPYEADCFDSVDTNCNGTPGCPDDPWCIGMGLCGGGPDGGGFDGGGGACSSFSEFVCNTASISQCSATCIPRMRSINCSSGVCTCQEGASMGAPCMLMDPFGPRCASCQEAFTQCCGW